MTYVCDLVLGADDSVLREFTEFDVVFVWKRVPEKETRTLNDTVQTTWETLTWWVKLNCESVCELYFWVKTPSMLQRADRGKLQEAEVSSSFPSWGTSTRFNVFHHFFDSIRTISLISSDSCKWYVWWWHLTMSSLGFGKLWSTFFIVLDWTTDQEITSNENKC